MADSSQSNVLEKGDIYFFYRIKQDVEAPRNLDDIQRFHLVMVPDTGDKARLFVVGKKCMPDIRPGESDQAEREWMMTDVVSSPSGVGDALRPIHYSTKTRGEREEPEAIPAGEGRYSLFEHKSSSRLAFRLESPDNPGKIQDILGIRPEASYVVSVRNPDLDVPGFPQSKPGYPKHLQDKFADKRWLEIDDTALLDYENVQLVLIGAHESLAESRAEIEGTPDLFGKLALDPEAWPTEALRAGRMASPKHQPASKPAASDRSAGGEKGGRKATESPSAAGIASALKGMNFPGKRQDLVRRARGNDANTAIIKTLEQLPQQQFRTMADVEKAVAEVR